MVISRVYCVVRHPSVQLEVKCETRNPANDLLLAAFDTVNPTHRLTRSVHLLDPLDSRIVMTAR